MFTTKKTAMINYDPNVPFRLEDFGFVLDSIEEFPLLHVAPVYRNGDLYVLLFADNMVVMSLSLVTQSGTGAGILYAGKHPACQYHGKILFEMMPTYKTGNDIIG